MLSAEALMKDIDITQYLKGWQAGMYDSLDELFPAVYDQLRSIARQHFRKETPYHTLQPTILVNEAYCRMHKSGSKLVVQNRAHFFALAGRIMRQILVDHARKKGRIKRGKDAIFVTYSANECFSAPKSVDVLNLHEALEQLETIDRRLGDIVELLFFAGLTMAETGKILELSERTIKREWRVARAWLYQNLNEVDPK